MGKQAKSIIIATRKSQLAVWQAEHVRAQLLAVRPNLQVKLLKMVSQGDKILDSPLAKVGGKGLFVKELENGLLSGQADIAVHSMKDVPAELPDGLQISAILEREDPRDAFVSNDFTDINDLPEGALVGTSSLRRQAQLICIRPDLQIKSLRGNVNTRLEKLDKGDYQAIILASAGLLRLGMKQRIRSFISSEDILPAIGQGAIGVESRVNDEFIIELLSSLHDPISAACVNAERAFNARLQGGCQVPIGGYAVKRGQQLFLRGLVAAPDGSRVIAGQVTSEMSTAQEAGLELANSLLAQGAGKILKSLID